MARMADLRSRAVLRTADELGISHAHAVGLRELLCATAFQKADATIGDERDVELTAGWEGERGRFVAAALAAGMIVEVEPGLFALPDFDEAAPRWAKKRAKSAEVRAKSGKTISDLRAEAGLKSAAVRASKRATNGQQTDDLPPFLPTSPPPVPPAFEKEEREGAPLSLVSPLTGEPTPEEWGERAKTEHPDWSESDVKRALRIAANEKGWPRGWRARQDTLYERNVEHIKRNEKPPSPHDREKDEVKRTIQRARGEL